MAAAGGGARAEAGLRKFLVEHQPCCNATVPKGSVVDGGKRKVAAAGVPTEPRYRDAQRRRPRGRYSAEIRDQHKGVWLWLGTFDTAEEAARRYDSEACRLRGPSENTNFLATLDYRVPLPALSLHALLPCVRTLVWIGVERYSQHSKGIVVLHDESTAS
ncbi:ethylene-responsive transcription factor 7 [Zea mays]|jgi:hypothetical protein|uniref:AP2/ERF domain-containing protein n=1 Tax=Zea mays TaxID=4577 RepID=A0A1D6IUR5_MAIZE|nr:ethylene-responsive transcription factor 7 [Zea mays]XP_020401697.1 ethylene-responsive transcription factor 7 [Zea mays]AQK39760.1 hypothetical protein ZEAMMB73_Zm00001d023662 [Zea mays]|eukprot:XP_020401696.1 ethylene-responsive transcription factor 7 [Zea mays]